MATVRSGTRAALVVVDVQNGVMADTWERERVVANVAASVERAREGGVPVVWVQHEDDELAHESAAWQLVGTLQSAPGEARVRKRYESSFEGTALEGELARLGASHVVLAGAASNWCIRATAYASLDRGYDLTLLRDAHTTKSIELRDGSRVEAAGIVADLNVTMTWLQYPGRRCATAEAREFDFAAVGAGR